MKEHCEPFDFQSFVLCPFLPLPAAQLHHFKWVAVNDFVPGSHYPASEDMCFVP